MFLKKVPDPISFHAAQPHPFKEGKWAEAISDREDNLRMYNQLQLHRVTQKSYLLA
jgi:hypothetical protein